MRDQRPCETQPTLVSAIRHHYQRRVDFHRAEKKLTLQIKAVCRRLCDGDKGEAGKLYKEMMSVGATSAVSPIAVLPSPDIAARACGPMLLAREPLETQRKLEEKELVKLAKQLPVWPWVEAVRGVGPLSLAQVVGETRDLSNYANPAKLWKRMGLALVGDKRQGSPGKNATADDWIEHGYSASRRSVMFVIGDCMIKSGGKYREIYDEKKTDYLEREWCGKCHPAGETKPREHCTPSHAHNRAHRYMEKRFLRDLWRAWRVGEVEIKEEVAA